MEVSVDVQDRSGRMLTEGQSTVPAAQTTVFDSMDKAADAEVAKVIKANLGRTSVKARG